MDITVGAAVLIGIAVLVGASIQGSIGFGMNLVTVPVLALVLPDALPATVILLGIPISIAMLRHEHRAIDRRGVTWILIGRVPGTLAGTIVVATVSATALKGVIGVSVLVAVIASAIAPPISLIPLTQFAGGLVSGTTGTAAGIGGPPLALLYQHHDGPTMRATLAASFFFGTTLSAATLAVAGHVTLADCALAASLVPLVIGGSWLGRQAHGMLDRRWLRPAVLAFAAVAAIVVLVDAVR